MFRSTLSPGTARSRSLRILPALLVGLALLLTLAACGGSGGSSDLINLVITPVASPTTPPEAAPTVPPVTYRVKPGDTLSGIADMFGVTVDEIVRYNNIADPNSLSEGQVLIIPGRGPSPTPNSTATPTTIAPTQTATPSQPNTPVLPPPDVTPPLGPTTPPDS